MNILTVLETLRKQTGQPWAQGLSNENIEKFSKLDPGLSIAAEYATHAFHHLEDEEKELLKEDEKTVAETIQSNYVNFYAKVAIAPFVALAAYGPWIITAYGRVIHDNGGYGMLGAGHNPEPVHKALNRHQVMANIMTPNFAQARFAQKLNEKIGFARSGDQPPFAKYVCLNSGSEGVTMAMRFSDLNAAKQTAPGGNHAGKPIKIIAMEGAFHGRTDRPAQVSDSCLAKYKENLASFQLRDNLIRVEPNNNQALQKAWDDAQQAGVFIEAIMMEPVMGEGQPGVAVSPEFYKLARKLTRENQSLLIVDSIQAAIRAHGCLSIVDYPGFEDLDAPDVEIYSKALNAGQYPLSVLGLGDTTAGLYKTGIYGNTMTTNPRALDVSCVVLDQVTDDVRKNIVQKGEEFLSRLNKLNKDIGGKIIKVEGTGLLFAAHFDPRQYEVVGQNGLELKMRLAGINVIHGGENALRFTPHFKITSEEVDLIIETLKDILS